MPPEEQSQNKKIQRQDRRPPREIGRDRGSQITQRQSKSFSTSPDTPFGKRRKHDTKFSDNFGASYGKLQKEKTKRITLKDGSESPSFTKSPRGWNTPCKTKQLNGHMTAAPEGGCEFYGRRIRLADQPQ